jgi:hypothetical protein
LVKRSSFDSAAALNMLILPTTAQSLRNNVGYAQSQTLRTDANIQDLIRLSLATGGGIPVEMQFPVVNEALWLLLSATMRATEVAQASTASCTTTAGAKTITRAAGDFAADGYQVGDIVKNIGATPPGDNGFFKITVVSAATLTVEAAANFTGSVGNVTVVRGARMKNGTNRDFFDVEVARLDVSLFELFRKMAVDGLALTVSDNAITQAAFSLVGISSERSSPAPVTLSWADPTAGPILDALGVPVFNVGAAAFSAKSIGFQIANNIRPRTQVGTLGGTAMAWGAFQVTTRITAYYSNFTEINNFTGNNPTDMWFVMQDANNKALSFSFPQYKWSDLAADTRGLNQDDYLEGSGQAYLDPVELCTMRVQRWVA